MSWAISLIKTNGFTASGPALPVAGLNAGAGSLICACWSVKGATTITGFAASDSNGNSWSVHSAQSSPGALVVICWAVLSATWTNATLTLSRIGSGNISSYAYWIADLTGGGTAEDTAVLHGATGAGTPVTNTSNAAAFPGTLQIAATATFPAATTNYTEDAANDWTNQVNEKTAGSGDAALSVASQTNSGTSSLTHAPSLGTSSPWADMIIGFDLPIVSFNASGQIQSKAQAAGAYGVSLNARCAAMARGLAGANCLASVSARSIIAAMARALLGYRFPAHFVLKAPMSMRALPAPRSIRTLQAGD